MTKPRRRTIHGCIAALALVLVAAAPAAPTLADVVADLRRELDAALEAMGAGSRYSVLAVSLDTGDTLFAEGAHTALAPASNLKLLTSAAALRYLGPEYRYPTYLLTRGPVENGVLRGDLVLYGTGDPGISDQFQASRTAVFESFADALSARGVRSVEGDIVGDGSFFGGPLVAEGWDPRDLNDWFAAASSALSFNENMVTLRVVPTQPGQPPEVRTIPGNAELPIRNMARTVAGRASRRIEIKRTSPDQPISIEGEIPRGGREVWRQMTVSDPARYAASVFRGVLEERGIRVSGSARSVEAPAASAVTGQRLWAPALRDDGAVRVVASHRSPPLRDYLAVVNKKSHNLFADLALKTLGRLAGGEGSFERGAAVVEAFMASEAGVDTSRVQLMDGSGLSSLNRVSAADFVDVMEHMARSELWDEYWASLPEAGNPRELRRMYQSAAAGNLRAKTGTIENVSALSGLVRSANGERILFSIVVNNARSTWQAKRVEDRIGTSLASFERPFETRPAGEPTRLAAADTPVTVDTATSASERLASAEVAEAAEGEAEPAATETRTHTVAPGENLSVIARRHGVRVNAIVAANDGLSPSRLQPGQRLTIPGAAAGEPSPATQTDPERHVVASGENPTVIARRYGVSLNDLLDANPGMNPNRLQVGQELTIPASPEGGEGS
ncbi:MAG: D-alanyl-D-alanine carboxypeptidase/D-alanyl-D-alanine-endopeptidase [Gemmatimonadetes bacterium]|nr:D-alanyl-D-alanine carboxypeptidase/D-alanyl-D-alanine-endopeptidase [Gemmatimonadota bacterium]